MNTDTLQPDVAKTVENTEVPFSSLDLSKQVYAFCLTAKQKIDEPQVTKWIKFGRPDLTEENMGEIHSVFGQVSEKINWGGSK